MTVRKIKKGIIMNPDAPNRRKQDFASNYGKSVGVWQIGVYLKHTCTICQNVLVRVNNYAVKRNG